MTPRTPETPSHHDYTTPEAFAEAIGGDSTQIKTEWQRLRIERIRSTQSELDTLKSWSSPEAITSYLARKHEEERSSVQWATGEAQNALRETIWTEWRAGEQLATAVMTGDKRAAETAVKDAGKGVFSGFVGDWLKSLQETKASGGFMAALAGFALVILGPLAKRFGIELGGEKVADSAESIADTNVTAPIQGVEKTKEHSDRLGMSLTLAAQFFTPIPDNEKSPSEFRSHVTNIYRDQKFLSMPYGELLRAKESSNITLIQWEPLKGEDKHYQAALNGIGSSLCKETLEAGYARHKQEHPTDTRPIEAIPFEEIILMASSDLHVLGWLMSSDILSGLASVTEELKVQSTTDANGNTTLVGPLIEKAHSLWLTIGATKYLYSPSGVRGNTLDGTGTPEERIAKKMAEIRSDGAAKHLTDEDRTGIEKVLRFSVQMTDEIIGNERLNLWLWENFRHILSEKSMDFSEMWSLYVLTGGKPHFDKHNGTTQLMLMGYLTTLAADRWEVASAWNRIEMPTGLQWSDGVVNYVKDWISGTATGGIDTAGQYEWRISKAAGAILMGKVSEITLPPNVKNRLQELAWGAWRELKDGASGFAEKFGWIAKGNPELALGMVAMGAIGLFLPIWPKRGRHFLVWWK